MGIINTAIQFGKFFLFVFGCVILYLMLFMPPEVALQGLYNYLTFKSPLERFWDGEFQVMFFALLFPVFLLILINISSGSKHSRGFL